MTYALALKWFLDGGWKIVGAVTALVALAYVGHRVYNSIRESGAAEIRNESNKAAIDKLNNARTNSERNENEIRHTPRLDRIDQLP